MVEVGILEEYVHLPNWVDPEPFKKLPLMVRFILIRMANECHEQEDTYFSTDMIQEFLHILFMMKGFDRLLIEEFRVESVRVGPDTNQFVHLCTARLTSRDILKQ